MTKDEELPTNRQLATNISGGSISQDSSQPQDEENPEYATQSPTEMLEDSPEMHMADPPASLLPPLSSMTEQEKKTLLQSILDDKDMREQLTSLSSGMFPVTTTQSVAVGGDESLQSVRRLHEIRDDHCLPPRSLSADDLPSRLQTVNTGSLTTSTQMHESTPNPTEMQVSDPNPTQQSDPNPTEMQVSAPNPTQQSAPNPTQMHMSDPYPTQMHMSDPNPTQMHMSDPNSTQMHLSDPNPVGGGSNNQGMKLIN